MAGRILSRRFATAVGPRLQLSGSNARPVMNAAVQQQQQGVPEKDPRRGRDNMFVPPIGLFDIWDPISSSRSLRQVMDVMNRYGNLPEAPSNFRGGVRTPWDVLEKQDGFHLRMDMPGLEKSEIKINVEDEELVIRGEHKAEPGKDDFACPPRSYSTRMVLPKEVMKDQIKAELKNGVLIVFVPKQKPEEKKVTQVVVS